MKLYYNQFKEKTELTTKTVPNAKATELAANPMYLTICGFSFSKSVRPGAESRRVAAHGDDGTEEEGPKEGVRFEFWEGESREEEEEGVGWRPWMVPVM